MSKNEYENDKRPACKYGSDCYQKNPQHQEKYKHPPKKRKLQPDDASSSKKCKISDYFKINTKQEKEVDSSVSNVDVGDKAPESSADRSTPKPKNSKLKKEVNNASTEEQNGKRKTELYNSSTLEFSSSCKCTGESKKVQAQPEKGHVQPGREKVAQESPRESPLKEVLSVTSTTINKKTFIKEKFLFDMPSDFYDFWEFCKANNPQNPCDAFKSVGLKLVGVYDVLAGKFDDRQPSSDDKYLLHWRYYHDPPEVQTVLKGDDSLGYHIGYFRDSPDDPPCMLVRNCDKKDGVFQCVGDNIFAAVNTYLDELKKSGDPFKKLHLSKYQTDLKAKAEELGLSLSPKSDKIKSRDKKVVVKTFNKIGLVVPYNKKTQQGYRPLTIGNKEFKILLDKLEKSSEADRQKYLSELQPVLTYASIATDECDFGTGIELGWDIISHGVGCLNSTAARFLTTSYKLLNRDAFAKIAEVHMNNRKKGCNLSII